MRILRDVAITIAIALVIFFALRTTVQSFVVEGPSMEPNFHSDQRVLVSKVTYRLHEPERGDVIVFQSPNSHQGDLIKRIIGLPGESVEIRNGIVYVHQNGQTITLDEPYVADPPRADYKGSIIPADSYFVMGDNRNNSDDSRRGWLVPRQNIIGKAWLSTWPPGEWGLAANYPFETKASGAQ